VDDLYHDLTPEFGPTAGCWRLQPMKIASILNTPFVCVRTLS
jgi:hypothetical protein